MLNLEKVKKIAEKEVQRRYFENIIIGEPSKRDYTNHLWQVPLGYRTRDERFHFADIGVSLLIDGQTGDVLYAPPLGELNKVAKIYERERQRE